MQKQSHSDIKKQEVYSAVIRSLSGVLTANIRDWQLFIGSKPFGRISPHLSLEEINQADLNPRGVLDGIALRLKHSDYDLHLSLSPLGQIESLIFEVLEQIRVESLCPKNLIGMQSNLQSHFMSWLEKFISRGGVEGSIGLLLISIFAIVWMSLNNKSIDQLMQDMIEATRNGLAKEIGPLLIQLKFNKAHQKSYSKTSLQIVKLASNLIENEYSNIPSIRTKRKNKSDALLKLDWIPPLENDFADNSNQTRLTISEKTNLLKHSLSNYQVFNKTYDVEIKAQKKIKSEQLLQYRKTLDDEVSKHKIPWSKLAHLYQQIFLSNYRNRWQTTETEGLIDRRFLIRSVTSPLYPVIYKTSSLGQKSGAKISFLIDCSGSMKEQRLFMASCIDSLVRILDQIGVQTEVLGYTTNAWHGGRVFKEWRKLGFPQNPGRLNERAHWIFKDFNVNWKKSRGGIAALLRPEIYAESLDGEALEWAVGRMQITNTSEIFNHIILFSDGCPMDRATIEANGENFLKNHLIDVISWCNIHPNLSLSGCGLGHEIKSTFKNFLSWDINKNSIPITLLNWAAELKSTAPFKVNT